MQSIIDKLQAPQTFSQMTTEFLVTIQRLTDPEDTNFFLSIHPRFQILASIEILPGKPFRNWKFIHCASPNESISSFPESPQLPWVFVSQVLEAVHCVLLSLFNFTPKTKATQHHNSQQQQRNSSSRLVQPMIRSPLAPSQHQPVIPVQLQQQPLSYFPISPSSRGTMVPKNGYPTLQQQLTPSTAELSHFQGEPSREFKELLTESRMLRARMKELQEKYVGQPLRSEVGMSKS